MTALDSAKKLLKSTGGLDLGDDLTIIGEILVRLPLELKLCRLICYAANFGYIADGILMCVGLT